MKTINVSDSPLPNNSKDVQEKQAYTPLLNSDPTTPSDASSRVFHVFEPTTQNANAAEPSDSALTFDDFTPIDLAHQNKPSTADPAIPQPHHGPTSNPTEIFPTDLPPRPAPKRNVFARILTRGPKQTEDIELGPIPASHQLGDPTKGCFNLRTKNGRVMVACMVLLLVLFLGGLALAVYQDEVVKGRERKESGAG